MSTQPKVQPQLRCSWGGARVSAGCARCVVSVNTFVGGAGYGQRRIKTVTASDVSLRLTVPTAKAATAPPGVSEPLRLPCTDSAAASPRATAARSIRTTREALTRVTSQAHESTAWMTRLPPHTVLQLRTRTVASLRQTCATQLPLQAPLWLLWVPEKHSHCTCILRLVWERSPRMRATDALRAAAAGALPGILLSRASARRNFASMTYS